MSYDANSTPLRLCSFRGLQNLPIFVATSQGFFTARGLEVELRYTLGSAAQIAGLARGEYELIQTAPDNVISATSTPTVFGLADAAPRIVMLASGSVGPLSIYAHTRFGALRDLHGATVGVDNPDSGFALVVRDMLARAGLMLDQDYSFAVAGGTSARLDALKAGTVDATLLYPPYDVLAAAGFRRLAISTDYYAAYASLTTAALYDWVDAHPDVVTRYIAAILQALRWIFDPANAAETHALLREGATLGLDATTAAQALAAFIAPGSGYGVDARLDAASLDQVIALRARYGAQRQPLAPAAAYCDLRWYERARAQRG